MGVNLPPFSTAVWMSRLTAVSFPVQPNLNGDLTMSHTIILRHQGIDRTYQCQNKFDAIVLFDALTQLGSRVEMWNGNTLVQQYL